MKTKIFIPVLIFLTFLAGGCTQNNGNIGALFGSWVLEEMSVDGTDFSLPDQFYTTWSFQGEILMVTAVDDFHGTDKHYGTFSHSGQTLELNFTHYSDAIPEGTGIYSAPVWMGFPASGRFTLRVVELSGKNMVLRWTSPSDIEYIYRFRKTW